MAVTLVAAKVVQAAFKGWLSRLASKSKTQLDDILLRTFERPIYWIALVWGVDVSLETLVLPGRALEILGSATTVVVTVLCAWSASNLVTAMRIAYLDPWAAKSESKVDDQIIPIFERLVKVTVWVLAVLVAVSNLGYDIMSLVTGLGIGGLALAMAAKDTLSNVFGSVTILADRPFQVGDTVKLAGHTGTVEDVGLRTCRIRTLDGTVVTVPNANLVGGVVENVSARPAGKFAGNLGLVYSTHANDLKAAIAAIRALLEAHPKVRKDFAVRFINFGPSSLDIQVVYWVVPPSDYFDVVAEINMAIKERFDHEGWQFAYPSMTVYRADATEPAHARMN
jgi:MscS family membrane protein